MDVIVGAGFCVGRAVVLGRRVGERDVVGDADLDGLAVGYGTGEDVVPNTVIMTLYPELHMCGDAG